MDFPGTPTSARPSSRDRDLCHGHPGLGRRQRHRNNDRHYAAITASYPSSATTWTVVATIVAGTQANGNPPSLTAYALCGA